tara:strand:+ start:552 stop:812 length:261 start_codon:yes stop_codon:yes gene_type:complete
MKYLFLFIVVALILFPKETQNQTIDIYKVEWDKFCKTYMKWVNKYPKALSAGCCDIDHPSNDILKEGWEGESLLLCGYCDGEFCYG